MFARKVRLLTPQFLRFSVLNMSPPVNLKNQTLVDHYADAYHRGECDDANFASEGSETQTKCAIRIELAISDEVVQQAWFEADGCPVCESIASVTMEAAEGKNIEELAAITLQEVLEVASTESAEASAIEDAQQSLCATLPIRILQQAIVTPLDALDDDLADGTSFGGPSLREEC